MDTETFEQKLLRWWGAIFRFLFIGTLGTAGFLYFNVPGIEDMPMSQLTLKQVSGRIFAAIIATGAVVWFFKFPDEKSEGLPYADWGKIGGWFALAALTVIAFLVVW